MMTIEGRSRIIARAGRPWLLAAACLITSAWAQTIGTQIVGPTVDTISSGHAKIFQVTSNGGTLSSLSWYLDSGTTATKIQFGLYVGVSAPGGLSTPSAVTATGPFTLPGFACVPFTHIAMPNTWKWWIAILPLNGTAVIRDGGSGLALPSSSGTLAALPANWSGAAASNDGPVTAFGASTVCPTAPPPPPVTVSINPVSPSPICPTEQLTATVTNAANTTVTWKTSAGTIDANGLFCPPNTAQTVTATATSVQDPTKSATAQIVVGGSSGGNDFTVSATWNQDFTNFASCSTTVTKGCISGFTWGYIQGAAQIPLKTSSASVCSGNQPEACADSVNSKLPMGSITFYVVTNYVDNNGTAGSVAPPDLSPPVTVSTVQATNLQVTVK